VASTSPRGGILIPDRPPTLRERGLLTVQAHRDPMLREEISRRCREDPAWFCNFALWTFDPRELESGKTPHLPFILYEFQVHLIRWYEERYRNQEDGIILKSRDMGASWVAMAWLLWHWLFDQGFQALIGSRTEDLVDNRLVDSHFGRLDYMLERLPSWLKPEGFLPRKHRFHMKLINPANGSAIKGESSQGNFGRQGRFSVIFIDELAHWEKNTQERAWRSASEATRCRIAVSTVNGADNLFWRLWESEQIPRLQLHWRLHPRKDEAWYQRQLERKTREEILQELEMDPYVDQGDLVYPGWQGVRREQREYDPNALLYCSWDFGLDTTCIIWWQVNRERDEVVCLDAIQRRDMPVDWFIPFVTGELEPEREHLYSMDERAKIQAHRKWAKPIHFGDPAGGNRHVGTGLSVLDILKQHGIYVFTNQKARDYLTRKQLTEIGIRRVVVNVNPGSAVDASLVDEAMSRARKDERGRPIHDGTSHLRSAVEYFFVNLPPFRRLERPEPVVRRMAYDQW